jgi:hypothetical protein
MLLLLQLLLLRAPDETTASGMRPKAKDGTSINGGLQRSPGQTSDIEDWTPEARVLT